MKFEQSVHVAAPVDEVFARSSDIPWWPKAIPAITRTEVLDPGPLRPGVRFRETRAMFGREHTEQMTVHAWAPPGRWSFVAESHGCRFESEFVLEQEGTGTKLTLAFESTPVTTLARVMAFLMRPMAKKVLASCAADLEHLRQAIESGRSATKPA